MKKYIEQLEDEIKQLHLTIARLTESHQKEMRKEIEKQQSYLDRLADKIDQYDKIIKVHNQMGGK